MFVTWALYIYIMKNKLILILLLFFISNVDAEEYFTSINNLEFSIDVNENTINLDFDNTKCIYKTPSYLKNQNSFSIIKNLSISCNDYLLSEGKLYSKYEDQYEVISEEISTNPSKKNISLVSLDINIEGINYTCTGIRKNESNNLKCNNDGILIVDSQIFTKISSFNISQNVHNNLNNMFQ